MISDASQTDAETLLDAETRFLCRRRNDGAGSPKTWVRRVDSGPDCVGVFEL